MQLDEFLALTLEQIVRGVTTAQRAVDASGAKINPQVDMADAGRLDFSTSTVLQDVEFDLAVSVEKSAKTDADLGVSVWAIKAGAGGASETRDTAANRIRFRVPIVLPRHDLTVAKIQ